MTVKEMGAARRMLGGPLAFGRRTGFLENRPSKSSLAQLTNPCTVPRRVIYWVHTYIEMGAPVHNPSLG